MKFRHSILALMNPEETKKRQKELITLPTLIHKYLNLKGNEELPEIEVYTRIYIYIYRIYFIYIY